MLCVHLFAGRWLEHLQRAGAGSAVVVGGCAFGDAWGGRCIAKNFMRWAPSGNDQGTRLIPAKALLA